MFAGAQGTPQSALPPQQGMIGQQPQAPRPPPVFGAPQMAPAMMQPAGAVPGMRQGMGPPPPQQQQQQQQYPGAYAPGTMVQPPPVAQM